MATAVTPRRDPAVARRPGALLPVGTARLLGFTLLGALGALEWQRMVARLAAADALLWVLVGLLAAAGVLACERLPPRARAIATVGVAALALPAAWVVAGLDLGLFRVSRWAELGDGIARGTEALSSVALPYTGVDPWPARVLQALGSVLCVLAGLLSVWPRGTARGYSFLSLAALLVLVAVPVVSLGGTRPVLLGVVLAALTVVFLLLERLAWRPGVGVAALLGIALAGALPLGAFADKDEPWFDYKAFAESLGPEDPVSFNWAHGDYGPITWTRTGAEVLRVATPKPAYWKVRTLEDFDGRAWTEAPIGGDRALEPQYPADYANRPSFNDSLQVTIRRMEGRDVVAAGAILAVRDATRPIVQGSFEGSYVARTNFARGDSYVADVYVPRPTPAQLARAPVSPLGGREDDRTLRIPITSPGRGIPRLPGGGFASYADVQFAGFDGFGFRQVATYPRQDLVRGGATVLRHSPYARTWRLVQRLRRGADSAYDYVLAVNSYLQDGFSYDERPPAVPPGTAPLDGFLFDTKAGYCQHFSAAMALMLRMGGIPARVATGFSPGGYSKARGAWIVRDTDAHSWVEVWFEGIGWVPFDATPSATPARSQIAAIDPAPEGDDPSVIGNSAFGGAGGDPRNDPSLRAGTATDARAGTTAAGSTDADDGPAWWAWVLGIAGTAILAGGLLFWRHCTADAPKDAEEAIAELERALRRSGRVAPAGTTLSQLERRLNLSGDSAGYVRALRAGRYASSAPQPSREQRRALRRDLADGLGPIRRLRVLWALPPRMFARRDRLPGRRPAVG